MTARSTWFWFCLAGALFALVWYLHQHPPPPNAGPARILPALRAAQVTRVRVQPANAVEMCFEREGGAWRLTQPVSYPAQSEKVEVFLQALEHLTAAAYITPGELQNRASTDEEFGFTSPAFTVVVEPGNYHLHVGLRTVPGDQVFLQVVGSGGIYVVDANFLKALPSSNEEWRSTALIDLKALDFDRVLVTNAAAGFGLQRDELSHLWRLLPPIEERADSGKIETALQSLQDLRVRDFVQDDPGKADLENLGLAPPELGLTFARGTNLAAVVQFGKSPTNDANLVFSRRLGQGAVVRVPAAALAVWREKADAFRDPHLLELTMPVASIEVHAHDAFSITRQDKDGWRVMPQNLPADPQLVGELLTNLCQAQVSMVKGVVIAQDLGGYGLAPPARQYIVQSTPGKEMGASTNQLIAELDFGTTQGDKAFARRAGESAVYSISRVDLEKLPTTSWQMRDRQIWSWSTNDLAAVTIRQNGKTRRMLREGPYKWTLAPGSQGAINELALEEAARAFCQLSAYAWVARGEQDCARYGVEAAKHQITFELKNGEQRTLAMGQPDASGQTYAAVQFGSESWVFEFPGWLYQFVPLYLSLTANSP